MRQEQFDLLQQRAEQLTDIFLKEADPATWPGAGIDDISMDAKTRGDRYWTKKNAFATMSLVQRIVGVIDTVRRKTAGGDGADSPDVVKEHEEDDLEKEAASAEREAAKMLKKATTSAQKVVAHGKA
jgi:hypothetical protein